MQAWEEPISSRGSYRYIMSEDTDQFSRMINNIKRKKKKNMIILPQLSPHDHHQLYSYGYGDIFFSDVPMLQTDNKNILNANEISSFSMDSNLDNQQDQQLDEALPFFPQPSIKNYRYSAASAVPSMESVDQHSPSFHLNIMRTSPRCDYDDINAIHRQQQQEEKLLSRDPVKLIKETLIMGNFQSNNCSTRKRGRIPEEKPCENEWKSNKKRAAVCCRQEQSQDYQFLKDVKEVHRAPPVRRSQKLAERITALQKLVSPYGKTDTASVLYEASIFIKVLQDQIQNIFTSLPDWKSNQHKNTTTGKGKELDLRNKGLCLVPVWLTQKFVEGGMKEEEDGFSQYCSSS